MENKENLEGTWLAESSSPGVPPSHPLPHNWLGALGPQVRKSISTDISFRDWDVESRNFKYAEKNFYLERWKQVKGDFKGNILTVTGAA